MKVSLHWCTIFPMLFFSPACSEDPQKLATLEKQKTEIAELTGQIAVLQERISQLPPDVTKELAKAEEETKAIEEELTGLESEISALHIQKRELQSEFDTYKVKYPTK